MTASYLLRLVLPDRPGALGAVATALGAAGGDIVSLDIVERGPDGAVDDMIVELPANRLPESLYTAAHSVPGVQVEALRPFFNGWDLAGELELVEDLAENPEHAMAVLVRDVPGVFRAGWAVLLQATGTGEAVCLAASAGAPEISQVAAAWLPLEQPRRLLPAEGWNPERWAALGMELAAAPVRTTSEAILLGRAGGPRFRSSEVARLAHLAGIAASLDGR